MLLRRIGIVLLLTSALSTALAQTAPIKPVSCDRDPNYHKLDFWLGNWDVFDIKSGTKDGTNRIEKTLKGCAIIENWTEPDGSKGKSSLYVQRATGQWKQVWVEDSGGMKEKSLQGTYSGPGVRFQGEILHKNGGSHLDRTTLQETSGGGV